MCWCSSRLEPSSWPGVSVLWPVYLDHPPLPVWGYHLYLAPWRVRRWVLTLRLKVNSFDFESFWLLLEIAIFFSINTLCGFPSGSDVKESCNVGDLVSVPGSERSVGVGNGNPLQYSCLESSIDREARRVYGSQRVGHEWAVNTMMLFIILKRKIKLSDVSSWRFHRVKCPTYQGVMYIHGGFI